MRGFLHGTGMSMTLQAAAQLMRLWLEAGRQNAKVRPKCG